MPGSCPFDVDQAAVREWFENNTHPLVTTDYVVDELLTVLKMRGEYQRALEVCLAIFNGDICHLEWVTQADVKDTWLV